jgi:hypothetical protein
MLKIHPKDWRCGSSGRDLLCKHAVLNSNPSPTKNKTKQQQKYTQNNTNFGPGSK